MPAAPPGFPFARCPCVSLLLALALAPCFLPLPSLSPCSPPLAFVCPPSCVLCPLPLSLPAWLPLSVSRPSVRRPGLSFLVVGSPSPPPLLAPRLLAFRPAPVLSLARVSLLSRPAVGIRAPPAEMVLYFGCVIYVRSPFRCKATQHATTVERSSSCRGGDLNRSQ